MPIGDVLPIDEAGVVAFTQELVRIGCGSSAGTRR